MAYFVKKRPNLEEPEGGSHSVSIRVRNGGSTELMDVRSSRERSLFSLSARQQNVTECTRPFNQFVGLTGLGRVYRCQSTVAEGSGTSESRPSPPAGNAISASRDLALNGANNNLSL